MIYFVGNLSLAFISICLWKILRKKGIKSTALAIILIIIFALMPISMISVSINSSISSSTRFAFAGTGQLFRGENKPKTEETKESTILEKQNYKMNDILDNRQNSVSIKKPNDFSIISSFDCFSKFPSGISDFINEMIKKEFELAHADFYAKHIKNEKFLPKITNLNTTCFNGKVCQSTLSFDRAYGETQIYGKNRFMGNNTLTVDNAFFCCSKNDLLYSPECDQAELLTKTSPVRDSNQPVLLANMKNELFLTKVENMYEFDKNKTRLNMIQVPVPDVLQLR